MLSESIYDYLVGGKQKLISYQLITLVIGFK
jgi:hypothetical protein